MREPAKYIVCLAILYMLRFFSVTELAAQDKTIILTRKIEKQLALKKDPRIFVNTERGIIRIRSWEKNEVKVLLKLSAKNKDIEKAREELDYMNYSISETRNTVFISNRMILKKPEQQISSVIRAEYEILVPRDIEIHLDNRFGNVKIEQVSGGLFGELYYSDITISRFNGDINLHISTGDFSCSKSILNGMVFTRHANISINETGGKLRLETEYGKIQLIYSDLKLYAILITQATDISMVHKLCYPLELVLDGSYCSLEIDKGCYIAQEQYLKSNYDLGDEQKLWRLRYLPPDKTTRMVINAKFGSINLR